MDPVLALVGLVGLTLVVTTHRHFAPVRAWWPGLLACPMCLGFELGWWTDALWLLRHEPSVLVRVVDGFLYGGAVSAVSYFLYAHYDEMGAP